jgi:thymidylate synthase (FAD)
MLNGYGPEDLNVIKVLDHGYVRLVSHMGSDLSIVRAARVSYDADWRVGEDEGKDEKLIKYLYTNKHSTPFETVVFTFEVKAPIFVLRQWHRHRTWTYNEVSARYTELPEEFYIPDIDKIGEQDTKNKQARLKTEHGNPVDIERYNRHCIQSFILYKSLLELKWPRELARCVLPLATYSRMFATVDLHNLFHFLRLRLHKHAQYEIQEYSKALLSLIKPIVPVASRCLEDEISSV